MDTIDKVISITKKGTGAKALKWNGVLFEDKKGNKGMYVGYTNQNDYYVYWYEERVLAHHTQQISAIHTMERGSSNGSYQVIINEQQHERLWSLRREQQSIEFNYDVLDKKQLPGFIHCMEVEFEDNAPLQERYIALTNIISLHPHPDGIDNIYALNMLDGDIWAYIPDHQFQN